MLKKWLLHFSSTGFGTKNVSCDFDTDCGYVDESEGSDRWISYTDDDKRNCHIKIIADENIIAHWYMYIYNDV